MPMLPFGPGYFIALAGQVVFKLFHRSIHTLYGILDPMDTDGFILRIFGDAPDGHEFD